MLLFVLMIATLAIACEPSTPDDLPIGTSRSLPTIERLNQDGNRAVAEAAARAGIALRSRARS